MARTEHREKSSQRGAGRTAPAPAASPKGGRGAAVRPTGRKIALRLALPCGVIGLLAGLLATMVVVRAIAPGVPEKNADAIDQGWILGAVIAALAAGGGAIVGFVSGSRLSARITDLGLAVSKLGRGGTEVRVRSAGSDEIAALGRSLQYLANDLAALMKDLADQEQRGGALATMDPLVRQLRDRTVPQALPQAAGYELDAALSKGSRGGLDYFDVVAVGDTTVCYLASGEGHGSVSVVAARMARDELQRALEQGAPPRKALNHANKVLKQNLPASACAKATLLQLLPGGAKLYQAGARAPLWICQRGELLELAAEGLALGLDDGPVFDKALRSQEVTMNPGTRLVLVNEAALRSGQLAELVKQHSPRHTAMFMNMVLGSLEQDAGEGGLREDVVLITAKRAGQQ